MPGYYIVDPGLAEPQYGLSCDSQVKCLSYLINTIQDAFASAEASFTVIPVHYLGPEYPAIGMSPTTDIISPQEMTRLSFQIGEELNARIEQMGVDTLVQKASRERLTWRDVRVQTNLAPATER